MTDVGSITNYRFLIVGFLLVPQLPRPGDDSLSKAWPGPNEPLL